MRSHRSQTYVSRKMGYSYNQAHRWESGYRQISWTDFVRFAHICGVETQKVLGDLLAYPKDSVEPGALVRHLIGDSSLADIARITGFSRHKVARWAQGSSCPSLDEVLWLVDKCRLLLPEFIGGFVDIEKVPYLVQAAHKKQLQIDVQKKWPIAGLILRVFELEQYRNLKNHPDDFFSSWLDADSARGEQILEEMCAAGMIRLAKGKYETLVPRLEITSSFEVGKILREFWCRQGLEFIAKQTSTPQDALVSYRVFSASPEAYALIKQRITDCYSDIRSILANDRGPTSKIGILNVHLFDPTSRHG